MHTSPVSECDAVQRTEQAQGTIEVADILTDWSWVGCWLPLRLQLVGRFAPSVGNKGQNIGSGDEGCHAEKADEFGLDESRHDQSRDVCHGGDRRDSEEDALVTSEQSCHTMKRAYLVLLIPLVVLGSKLRDELLLL